MSGNGKKNITATILEKVARNSVKAAAEAADRNEKVFQIRKLHKKENTAIYVIKITYMAVFFWKSFVITVCFINVNEFKEIGK